MNFTNIKTIATTEYQLKTSSGKNEFGADNIKEQHMDTALISLMSPFLGGYWYRNYFNRPELQAANITSIEQYTSNPDYMKITCDAPHYLTDNQDVELVITDSVYDKMYKCFLIVDSTTKTGYELNTFLIYEDFTVSETGTFEDQIKKSLDICLAIFTVEISAEFIRNPYQFDWNYKQFGHGDKKFTNWDNIAKIHASKIRTVGKILSTFNNDRKDNFELGFAELL